VLGTHDVAKASGLHLMQQTLGSTLASYGFGPGPYIILPFFPGKGMRDALDSPFSNGTMNPFNHTLNPNVKTAISAGTLISERADILPFTDHVTQTSPDPYVTIRTATHQNRENELSYPSYYKCRNIKR
jgi:phospholipid-binding lipoprotein MlaA